MQLFIHNSSGELDVLLTRSLITTLRQNMPESHITLQTSETYAYLWSDLGYQICGWGNHPYYGLRPTRECPQGALFINTGFSVYSDIYTKLGYSEAALHASVNRQLDGQGLAQHLRLPIRDPKSNALLSLPTELSVESIDKNAVFLDLQKCGYDELDAIAARFPNRTFYSTLPSRAANCVDCSALPFSELASISPRCHAIITSSHFVTALTKLHENADKPRLSLGTALEIWPTRDFSNPTLNEIDQIYAFLAGLDGTTQDVVQTHKSNSKTIQQKPTVLFVSHKLERCGVAQYGRLVNQFNGQSTEVTFIYAECSDELEFKSALEKYVPDIVLYNYHPGTLPWVNAQLTRSLKSVSHVALMHECDETAMQKYGREIFDFHIFQDPTMPLEQPYHFRTGRPIPPYENTQAEPDIFTVGTIGFGFGYKGVEVLVATVQHQFDRARLNLNLPFNQHTDPDGETTSLILAERCRKILYKPGIELNINHEFLPLPELLDVMAQSSINAFLYSGLRRGGISSVIDLALAVKRPIAISRCEMFRHVYNASPSIFAEDSSLAEIAARGIEPLRPFYEMWSEAGFIASYNQIFTEILRQRRTAAKQHSDNTI